MREHQIVINLKRDQFEEVQRLARLAGSKSVSAYLKERVLALLLESEATPEKTDGPTIEDMLEVNHELSRMHRELQVFIAESLSNSVYSGDEELENEFDPDNFDQTFAAFQEMERNMEEEIERMKAGPDTRSGTTSRAQQTDTINNSPVDPYSMHGAQAFKRSDTPRPGVAHRAQTSNLRRSTPEASTSHSEPTEDEDDYPITGFPLESDDVLDASAEIPGMEDEEPIVLPPTPGASGRTRSNQRIKIVPTAPPPSPEEQAAHWKAQQMPIPKQSEAPTNPNSTKDSPVEVAETNRQSNKSSKSESSIALNNTGVPDALPPSDWSGHPVANFVESAGIYANTPAESIWFTPPSQVVKPDLKSAGSGEELPDDTIHGDTRSKTTSSSDTALGGTAESTPADTDTISGDTPTPRSQFAQPDDELEDLAERAFAISPRLGTFDSSPKTPAGIRKRQVPDPLDDLIDGSIMEEAQRLRASNQIPTSPYDDGVVYAFGGPETLNNQLPEDQVANNANPADLASHNAFDKEALLVGASDSIEDTEVNSDRKMRAIAQSTSGNFPTASTEDIPNGLPVSHSEESINLSPNENETVPASSAPSPDPSVLGGPPPKRKRNLDDLSQGDDDEIISGGPPPKRRKK